MLLDKCPYSGRGSLQESGKQEFVFVVDPDDEIKERRDLNNERKKVVLIKP